MFTEHCSDDKVFRFRTHNYNNKKGIKNSNKKKQTFSQKQMTSDVQEYMSKKVEKGVKKRF